MAIDYDPAKQPCEPNYQQYLDSLKAGESVIEGPGGTTTHIENNEKGILETNLFNVISKHKQAALGSDHDPQRQGIYATNSVGDND